LSRAKIILGAGVGEDAGRNAYLASFHAAQALILARNHLLVTGVRPASEFLDDLANRGRPGLI